MSAIWGCIDLSGKALPEGLNAAMEAPLHECRIDRFTAIVEKNVAMGCALTYIHEESEREPLPIYDDETGIYFTADVHIYNRDELLEALCPDRIDIPDGELLYTAYKKWGRDCAKRVYGSYAYAAYHSRENELVITADHMISRSIYYRRVGDRIYFSTLVEPMLCGEEKKPRLNKKWCAYFLAMSTYSIMIDDRNTPYEDVFRIPAAYYGVLTREREQMTRYWNPYDVAPLRLGSDDEYKAQFRELFEKCVRETVRIRGNVGIRLSSGFDSGAVAAFASKALAEQGRALYSFTHVPIERINGGPELPSEREGVLKLCEMYPNIVPKFMSTQDRDGIFSQKKIMGMGFFPVKSTTNIAWIDALSEAMANNGCKVALSGQYGNATISRGSMETYLITALAKGRIFHFIKTLNEYGKKRGFQRKLILRYVLQQFVPRFIRRLRIKDYLEDSIINREFARTVGIKKRDRELEPSVHVSTLNTFAEENKKIWGRTELAHISDSDTKLLLRYGMQTLDPSRDPRLMEFCLSLPMECFSRPGPQTRRLCRVYLADLYPPEVLPENAPRGHQSADTLERLIPKWEEVIAEMKRVCLSPQMREMADEKIVKIGLEDMSRGADSISREDFNNLVYVYSLGMFIESHEWE